MKSLKDSAESKIAERISNAVRSKYDRISVVPKQGLFNRQCHRNAVEYARVNKGHSVVEVIYIENDDPILHYVNYKNGIYYETTLGWEAETLEYYKIKGIRDEDHTKIHDIFNNTLKVWLMGYTNWWERKMLGVSRVV